MTRDTKTENKTELNIFSSTYIEELYRELIEGEGLKNYTKEEFPYKEKFPRGRTNIFIDQSLNLNPEDDLQSAISLYENLSLNETQASDPRLWTYLTHVTFWDYMRKRWPVDDTSIKVPENRVKSRYFLINLNLRTLTRNGISRLWWYSHLTVNTDREEKYALTKVLLSRADLTVGITERALGSNESIRTAILEFLEDNPVIKESENKTRELLTGLNLVGGPKPLSFLDKEKVKELLHKIKQNL